MIWKAADGREIPYEELTDEHLLNILAFIDRKANEGIVIRYGAIVDMSDIYYDEDHLHGEEVEKYFNKRGLLTEAMRRGLIRSRKTGE